MLVLRLVVRVFVIMLVALGGAGTAVAEQGVFDDEQNMKPQEQRSVDASEVGSDDCFGLVANELCPSGACAITGGVFAGGFENLPDF